MCATRIWQGTYESLGRQKQATEPTASRDLGTLRTCWPLSNEVSLWGIWGIQGYKQILGVPFGDYVVITLTNLGGGSQNYSLGGPASWSCSNRRTDWTIRCRILPRPTGRAFGKWSWATITRAFMKASERYVLERLGPLWRYSRA